MQDEGRSAGDRAPGLADDSLGDTQSVLPDLEREAEERRRAQAGRGEDAAAGAASEGDRGGAES